jgi:hypothetical protein
MADPTPELVQEFWDFMSGHYRSKVINRSNAWEMKVVARFLSLIKAMDVDTFMKEYATTRVADLHPVRDRRTTGALVALGADHDLRPRAPARLPVR